MPEAGADWAGRPKLTVEVGPTSGVVPEPAVAVARLVRAGEGSPLGAVVVELNGARIEVEGAAPASTLRAVFDVLREGSPRPPRWVGLCCYTAS